MSDKLTNEDRARFKEMLALLKKKNFRSDDITLSNEKPQVTMPLNAFLNLAGVAWEHSYQGEWK